MKIDNKTRTELKQFFKSNDKPTEEEFAELINSSINQAEDGIAKTVGNPLAIQAEGEPVGDQGMLDFYSRFADDNPQWSINLNPRVDPQEPSSNQPGFNIKDITGLSRFFIKAGNGNIGMGTIDPTSKVTIEGKNTASLLSVVDSTDQRSTILEVHKNNGVAIKGALNVDGDFMSKNVSTNVELDDGGVNNKIPTQKAVKAYVDERLPKGLISLWSGQTIPVGWALCDGRNNTPNLSGQFIVGQDKASNDYKDIGQTGGAKEVALTTEQMPSHKHTDSGHNHGINDPGHNHHYNSQFNRLVRFTGNDTTLGMDNNDGAGEEYDLKRSREMKTNTTGISIKTGYSNIQYTGGNQAHENRPPYYVLAYIMKL
ncbi:MAG: hypothetical protein AB8B56_18640 [Crocinitomicaceae bacterium]